MLLGQIELAYWGEVTKLVKEAQEYRKQKLSDGNGRRSK